MTARIGIGIVGTGFLAATRARCYARLGGICELVAVHARGEESAADFAARNKVRRVHAALDDLLGDDAVALVDLCVPNHLHRPFTERAAAAGKSVLCTKPLAAYVGQDLAADATDDEVSATPRSAMLARVVADAEAMVAACANANVALIYGENWIHAPGFRRATALSLAAHGPILEMRGHESHSGSHSPYAKHWRHTGGGALLRLGAHPIGAMLHLKTREGLARDGRPIRPISVTADVADPTTNPHFDAERARVASGWIDVESWGAISIAFEDGTRGLAIGSDLALGGMTSSFEIFAADHRLQVNLSPHDLVRSFGAESGVYRGAYMMEKCDSDAGWTTPLPDEDWTSGHLALCEDAVAAVRDHRPPLADGALGLDVARVIYSGYVAAAEGRRVPLDP